MSPAESEQVEERIISDFLASDPETVATVAGWAREVADHRAWGFESPDDIVQATLLALVRNLQDGRFASGDLRRYVRTIAKNISLSGYRRARTRGVELPLGGDEGRGYEPADTGIDPERLSLLDRILGRLDESCRQIIGLAYLQGFSRREIAQRLGITEGAAKVRLFRCLEKARSTVELVGGTS